MRSGIGILAGVVVIAAIVFLLAKLRGQGEPDIVGVKGPDGGAARSLVVMPGADGSARTIIRVHSPVDGAHARLDELETVTFSWTPVEGARSYMFIANNEFGDLVWRSHSRDTTMTLPGKVRSQLIVGDRLKWLVQAANLGASTDLHRLVLD